MFQKQVRLLECVFKYSVLFVVFLGFSEQEPACANLACSCRLDYAHAGFFMRVHELAQKP